MVWPAQQDQVRERDLGVSESPRVALACSLTIRNRWASPDTYLTRRYDPGCRSRSACRPLGQQEVGRSLQLAEVGSSWSQPAKRGSSAWSPSRAERTVLMR